MTQNIKKVSVGLDAQTIAIVADTARLRGYGERGASLALRQIIREWHRMTGGSQPVITPRKKASK